MKRGDMVTVALQGDLGKPRPALVIQSDLFAAHPSVTILPVTSDLRATPLFRVPGAGSGLSPTPSPAIPRRRPQPVATINASGCARPVGRLVR